MGDIVRRLRHKLLLGVFKTKRLVSGWMGVRTLDYPRAKLSLHVDTVREWQTRAASCAKEPETVAWIEREASGGGVLYDIGANIGAYSLVAAANGLRVVAVEPAFQNFYQLNRNVTLNGMDDRISCFPVALSSETKIADFTYLDLTTGTSRAYYNERGEFHIREKAQASKATMIYAFDELIETFGLPAPALLKVDVDGAELDFVRGAGRTLARPELRGVLIEVDIEMPDSGRVRETLESSGFGLVEEHVRDARTRNLIFRRV